MEFISSIQACPVLLDLLQLCFLGTANRLEVPISMM